MTDKTTATPETVDDAAAIGSRVQAIVRLTVEQRLMAAERFYRSVDERFADGLRLAVAIVQPAGWQHIAPSWAEEIEKGLRTLGSYGPECQ